MGCRLISIFFETIPPIDRIQEIMEWSSAAAIGNEDKQVLTAAASKTKVFIVKLYCLMLQDASIDNNSKEDGQYPQYQCIWGIVCPLDWAFYWEYDTSSLAHARFAFSEIFYRIHVRIHVLNVLLGNNR